MIKPFSMALLYSESRVTSPFANDAKAVYEDAKEGVTDAYNTASAVATEAQNIRKGVKTLRDGKASTEQKLGAAADVVDATANIFCATKIEDLVAVVPYMRPVVSVLRGLRDRYAATKNVPKSVDRLQEMITDAGKLLIRAQDAFEDGPWLRGIIGAFEHARTIVEKCLDQLKGDTRFARFKRFIFSTAMEKCLKLCREHSLQGTARDARPTWQPSRDVSVKPGAWSSMSSSSSHGSRSSSNTS